ncbi:D-glycero-beta-D-manno-heptose-7-phosphate kinase [uncultured Desulfovibrio sp.]|uniref:D-glycero-beta-D-manno-heptose-7-phosphate kinase n=1 Tax=uncultured Desulfovibrio sp. TaxID=167968 RepID=UPI00280603D4|nr:D-glycero-beta-D-manno-heptose-7-phosphate kinase [uncultured Desulfovibrio sp.]
MNFDGVRILVVGDVMLDHYIAGQVKRISPEAPVPVVSAAKRWSVPGGAANVARNLVRLGVDVAVAGVVGQDAAANDLRAALAAEGIADGLAVSPSRRTTCKTRVLAQGQQLLRLDEEVSAPLGAEEADALKKQVLSLLPGRHAVILSDYAKGVLLESASGCNLCQIIIEEARQLGIPVLVDPKGSDWRRYAGAHCVTPNAGEFDAACGLDAGVTFSRPRRETLAGELRSRYGIERLLITRGPKGMALFTPDEAPVYCRAAVREVADVSGAGDTAIATLAACVGKGLPWAESMHLANAAAGVAVGKMGTSPVSIAELNEALREQADNPKLFSVQNLVEKIEEWRRKNETVVFTNGCFDLLHPGHISLIRQSAAQGDHLIVGLNSDASVRRLKGPTRPIQNESSRALLLAALSDVDAIVLFDEDTPFELISALRPDVLVKGSDYTIDNVVGADVVQQGGGRVYLARLVDGCSTTGIVRKIDNQRDVT